MGKRVCNETGCPILIDGPGRCPAHARAKDKQRGSRQARGYDAAHDAERKRWAKVIERMSVPCARCRQPITAGMAWHLDHTDDRTGYLGPSCATCNTSAGGKAAHRISPRG